MNIMNWIWFRLGKRHWNKRDLERALYYMRKGERAITDMSDHMIYAELLHNDGHSEEALTYLGQVARTAPDHRVHERRAYILRELGRDHDAIEDLNEAIRLNDDHYLTWFTRGITHKDLQQYDKAIADLKESMRREQQDTVISTYYELGMAYYESGNPKEAVIYFSKSVELPDRAIPIYYYMLAACLDLLDRLPDAVRALQAGIRLLTRYQEEEDGGYALFARSTNYSYEAFLIFQQQVRDSCDFRRVLADLYFRLGQYHDAERSIEEGLARFPDAHELYLKRAELRHHSGHKEEAKADLKQAIERSPDDYRAYFELARIYRRMVWRRTPSN
ncbi:tetratricopeptide repeat protein [Paenibacillus sp. JCM 10914]|uniref:tetratricopeptide repeat protein n=1 Tax=Paenibacillus sp. JCM 10914 TaxID=1236974 RepID=UPI0003CC31DA|nr:tetratricopeptide repeat protein [Paenibacillus sp. JCM 10914]GAE07829.1 hypothetical protein JCM10914_4076 [Paenibacillus sp. JCM 10914]